MVLAIIKKYVEDNPNITYSDLEELFPKKLEGSWGVFDTLDNAEGIFARSNRKRHFLKPEEIIKLNDSKIAVCTQWGMRNINNIIEKAAELNYEVNKIPE